MKKFTIACMLTLATLITQNAQIRTFELNAALSSSQYLALQEQRKQTLEYAYKHGVWKSIRNICALVAMFSFLVPVGSAPGLEIKNNYIPEVALESKFVPPYIDPQFFPFMGICAIIGFLFSEAMRCKYSRLFHLLPDKALTDYAKFHSALNIQESKATVQVNV